VNHDWRRLRGVVLESDDWGLCAWSPDERAYRALADTPAFRTPAGLRYGGSTLEGEADIDRMVGTLSTVEGADGVRPCLQANTIMAAPDYARFQPPSFEADPLPVVPLPGAPRRWRREGAAEAVERAREAGVWWPELHGLHHLPESAWVRALRRGASDARRAHEHESPICQAVEASGEFDPSEPADARTDRLARAVAFFTEHFGRPPSSLCPPDYRWDERLEADAERLHVTIVQGKGEQFGVPFPRIRRALMRRRWPHARGGRFYMPVRIPFEPSLELTAPARHVAAARAAVRACWRRGQPAAISTHRCNYVHLDDTRAAAGHAALRDLLAALAADGATFLVDAEVRDLQARGWSVRPAGGRGATVRYHGVPQEPIRFAAPPGTTGARIAGVGGEVTVEAGAVRARLHTGTTVLEWARP